MKNRMVVNIKGNDYTFILQSKSAYIKMHKKDSEGIFYPPKKEVYLNKATLAPRWIRHEIFHCYVDGSDTYSSSMKTDQMEELGAVITGDHSPEINSLAEKIFDYFYHRK